MNDDLERGLPPQRYAYFAAEAVRALNHMTLPWSEEEGAYAEPAEVADVLANLAVLADRLPQAINQAGAWLMAYDGSRLDETGVIDVVGYANAAEAAARDLAQHLHLAHGAAAHIGEPEQ